MREKTTNEINAPLKNERGNGAGGRLGIAQ